MKPVDVQWWPVPTEEFTVRLWPDDEVGGLWNVEFRGKNGEEILFVTCGQGPVHALFMAYDVVRSGTNRCKYPHEDEHCWCRESEEPWDYVPTPGDAPAEGGRMLYANVAVVECCRCGTRRRAEESP